MQHVNQDIRLLPPMLSDFARQAGVSAAYKLLSKYGGQRKYIPMTVKNGHWLEECLGLEAAQCLSELYGREWIEIPNAKFRLSRKEQIGLAKGSSNEVAKEYGVTGRYVRMCRQLYSKN